MAVQVLFGHEDPPIVMQSDSNFRRSFMIAFQGYPNNVSVEKGQLRGKLSGYAAGGAVCLVI